MTTAIQSQHSESGQRSKQSQHPLGISSQPMLKNNWRSCSAVQEMKTKIVVAEIRHLRLEQIEQQRRRGGRAEMPLKPALPFQQGCEEPKDQRIRFAPVARYKGSNPGCPFRRQRALVSHPEQHLWHAPNRCQPLEGRR